MQRTNDQSEKEIFHLLPTELVVMIWNLLSLSDQAVFARVNKEFYSIWKKFVIKDQLHEEIFHLLPTELVVMIWNLLSLSDQAVFARVSKEFYSIWKKFVIEDQLHFEENNLEKNKARENKNNNKMPDKKQNPPQPTQQAIKMPEKYVALQQHILGHIRNNLESNTYLEISFNEQLMENEILEQAIFYAAQSGDLFVFHYLKKYYAEYFSIDQTPNSNRTTLLMYASGNGHLRLAQYLIVACKANLTLQNYQGYHAFFYAYLNGHLALSNMILQHSSLELKNDYLKICGNKSLRSAMGYLCRNYSIKPGLLELLTAEKPKIFAYLITFLDDEDVRDWHIKLLASLARKNFKIRSKEILTKGKSKGFQFKPQLVISILDGELKPDINQFTLDIFRHLAEVDSSLAVSLLDVAWYQLPYFRPCLGLLTHLTNSGEACLWLKTKLDTALSQHPINLNEINILYYFFSKLVSQNHFFKEIPHQLILLGIYKKNISLVKYVIKNSHLTMQNTLARTCIETAIAAQADGIVYYLFDLLPLMEQSAYVHLCIETNKMDYALSMFKRLELDDEKIKYIMQLITFCVQANKIDDINNLLGTFRRLHQEYMARKPNVNPFIPLSSSHTWYKNAHFYAEYEKVFEELLCCNIIHALKNNQLIILKKLIHILLVCYVLSPTEALSNLHLFIRDHLYTLMHDERNHSANFEIIEFLIEHLYKHRPGLITKDILERVSQIPGAGESQAIQLVINKFLSSGIQDANAYLGRLFNIPSKRKANCLTFFPSPNNQVEHEDKEEKENIKPQNKKQKTDMTIEQKSFLKDK